MSSTVPTQRRGGKVKSSTATSPHPQTKQQVSSNPSTAAALVSVPPQPSLIIPPPSINKNIPIATVKRRKCGTGAFDEHWLNLDCCGLFCAMLTYCLHMYACYAICYILLPPWMSYKDTSALTLTENNSTASSDSVHSEFDHLAATSSSQSAVQRHMSMWGHIHCVAFCFIAGLACMSHFKAMTTDPGAVPPDAKPLPDPMDTIEEVKDENGNVISTKKKPQRGRRLCRRCNSFKPARAHHCSVCKRCIIKMDHHCPWVNNCVGIGNHKYFLLFIYYTSISCLYTMALLLARFFICLGQFHDDHHADRHLSSSHHLRSTANKQGFPPSRHRRHRHHHHLAGGHCLDEPIHLLNIVGLVVEAMLFGLFTSCMMVDQWDVVLSNVTHIDRLKGDNTSMSVVSGLTEVFGFASSHITTSSNSSSKDDSSSSILKEAKSPPPSPQQSKSINKNSNNNNNGRSFRFDWFLPFGTVCFPQSLRDDIMGYCRPCGSGGSVGPSPSKTSMKKLVPRKTSDVIETKANNKVEMQPLIGSHNSGSSSNLPMGSNTNSSSSSNSNSKMIKSVEEII